MIDPRQTGLDGTPTDLTTPPKPSWRKPVGILAMLAYIFFWAGLVAGQWPLISSLPILVQAPIYLFLGIIWIAPLRPLLIWMETGKWRE